MAEPQSNNEVTNADILEFLKEHMVMSEDFQEFKRTVATKKDVETLDARLAEMQLELEGIKKKLDDIEKRLKDDTDALAMEVVKLKKRVAALEQQLGIQQVAVGI